MALIRTVPQTDQNSTTNWSEQYHKLVRTVQQIDQNSTTNWSEQYHKLIRTAPQTDQNGTTNWSERYHKLIRTVPQTDQNGTTNWSEQYHKLIRTVSQTDQNGTTNWSEQYHKLIRTVAQTDRNCTYGGTFSINSKEFSNFCNNYNIKHFHIKKSDIFIKLHRTCFNIENLVRVAYTLKHVLCEIIETAHPYHVLNFQRFQITSGTWITNLCFILDIIRRNRTSSFFSELILDFNPLRSFGSLIYQQVCN